jgi:DNA processing protein
MSHERFVLRRGDAQYPPLLDESVDPPAVLYGIGDPAALTPGVAVVGARRATPYGVRCTRTFAGFLGAAGVTVISGAAIGCDAEAHNAALAACGRTVAVLGCGPDVDYPRRSAGLLAQLRAGHAVVSERPWGAEPTRWAFVRRNRIIAGLSVAVLVIEAGLPSGTFSTADAALDSGRDVLAVPGSVFSPESRGSNRLIRQGAMMITDVAELAAALGIEGGNPKERTVPEGEVMRALAADPMRPDDLARALGMDIVVTGRILGALEATGAVKRYADGRYGAA